MSVFSEAAAAIGVAEASFKGISALYDFIVALRDAPQKLRRIQEEIELLRPCLQELNGLLLGGNQGFTDDTGLIPAVRCCEAACSKLMNALDATTSPRSRVLSSLQFWIHRKTIAETIDSIEVAKQTTILTISVKSLSIQVNGNMANPTKQGTMSMFKIPESPDVDCDTTSPDQESDEIVFSAVNKNKGRGLEVVDMRLVPARKAARGAAPEQDLVAATAELRTSEQQAGVIRSRDAVQKPSSQRQGQNLQNIRMEESADSKVGAPVAAFENGALKQDIRDVDLKRSGGSIVGVW